MTELEVDILTADILNRHELSLGRSSHTPLALAWYYMYSYAMSVCI